MKGFGFALTCIVLAAHAGALPAQEIGEGCWRLALPDTNCPTSLQITQHGSYFAVNGVARCTDPEGTTINNVFGNAFAEGAQIRMGLTGLNLDLEATPAETTLTPIMVLLGSNLNGTAYVQIDEDDICAPGPTPCTLSGAFTFQHVGACN